MPPYDKLLSENRSLQEEVAHLKVQIDWLKKQLFGGGKSERLDRAQMLLKLEHLPLARQETMSQRWGARLSRQVMADWVGLAAG